MSAITNTEDLSKSFLSANVSSGLYKINIQSYHLDKRTAYSTNAIKAEQIALHTNIPAVTIMVT